MGKVDFNNYDSSWDLIKSEKGNRPKNKKLYEQKYDEWMERDWLEWLNENLTFPFLAKREEDDDDAYFTDIAKHEPFRLGHIMEVISIDSEHSLHGIIVEVKEESRKGLVPLWQLEVTDKNCVNFWAVREYVVWDANK